MKKLSIYALCIFSLLGKEIFAMEWKQTTLQINEIETKRGGVISIFVFLNEGFPKNHDKAIKRYNVKPDMKSVDLEIQFPDVPFAIKIHHDEDSSGTVTKDWTGFIPAEGLGFSSGASLGFTGPPSFSDAVIESHDGKKISIDIIYP